MSRAALNLGQNVISLSRYRCDGVQALLEANSAGCFAEFSVTSRTLKFYIGVLLWIKARVRYVMKGIAAYGRFHKCSEATYSGNFAHG